MLEEHAKRRPWTEENIDSIAKNFLFLERGSFSEEESNEGKVSTRKGCFPTPGDPKRWYHDLPSFTLCRGPKAELDDLPDETVPPELELCTEEMSDVLNRCLEGGANDKVGFQVIGEEIWSHQVEKELDSKPSKDVSQPRRERRQRTCRKVQRR